MEGSSGKQLVMVMLMIAMFGGYFITGEAYEQDCMAPCVQKCVQSGVSNLVCVKTCEIHCNIQAKELDVGVHYCNLGCIVSQCQKFNGDEKKHEICISNCRDNLCKGIRFGPSACTCCEKL